MTFKLIESRYTNQTIVLVFLLLPLTMGYIIFPPPYFCFCIGKMVTSFPHHL